MGLIIYRSSAGSGKTHTLVTQYLAIVLRSPSLFRCILAITFTNKASEELKMRIIRELDRLASGHASKHIDEVRKILQEPDEQKIRKNAGIVMEYMLHDYSSFAVSTIDSYFQQLARVLARELELPMNYEIELDSESISRNVTELLLDEAGKHPHATGWMEDLLLHQINNDKSWNIRLELKKMTSQLLKSGPVGEHSQNVEPQRLIELIGFIHHQKSAFETYLKGLGKRAMETMEKHGVTIDDFSRKNSGPAGFLFKLTDPAAHLKNIAKPNTYVSSAIEDPKNFLNNAAQNNPALMELASRHLHPILTDAVQYIQKNISLYFTISEVMKLIYQAGISNYLAQNLKRYREENHLFHLSDTTRILSKAVGEQDAPFIFEKSGNTYRHVFIDEFQDTSAEQWQILRPLVMNTLANGHYVILVGDAKQSIYRFRGGDMQLIVNGVKNQLAANNYGTEERILGTNYRSKANIIRFNNLFFPLAARLAASQFETGKEIFEMAYESKGVEQEINDKSNSGYVEISFIDRNQQEKEDSNRIDQKLPAWKKQALLDMSSTMDELFQKGYEPGDLVILVRTNQHENEIAGYLLNHTSIPFISSNALLLKTNQKVQLLLSCLRLLHDPSEVLHYAEINSYFGSEIDRGRIPFSKTELFDRENSWAYREIASKRKTLISLPLQLCMAYLLDLTGSDHSDPYLHRFLDLMQDYVTSNGNNLSGFLSWWDEHVDTRNWSVEAADAGDAVKIMTVHRSKGLEFPVVFIPFFDWSLKPMHSTILWAKGAQPPFSETGHLPVYAVNNLSETYFSSSYQTELRDFFIDTLNLIYVAFTRPVEKLFISLPDTPETNEAGKLLKEVIEQTQEWREQLALNNNRKLIFGENAFKIRGDEKAKAISIYEPEPFHTPTQGTETRASLILPAITVEIQQEEAVLGNIIHDLMSMVSKEEDILPTLDRILTRNGYEAYRNSKDLLAENARQIWLLLEDRQWTNAEYRILNEAEFFDEKGRIYRPDKVLIKDDLTIVADFKTGKKNERYNEQVASYCRILEKTGFCNLEGYIIYTTEREIVKVA